MLRTLSRLMLGLVLAIVFAGQAAFASRPCEQMDTPAAVVSTAPDHHAQPCHEEASATAEAALTSTQDTPSPGLCECAALLKTCLRAVPSLKTARAEPWSWRAPEAVAFASLDLTPDGPPPKA